jgi:hypothetical protein
MEDWNMTPLALELAQDLYSREGIYIIDAHGSSSEKVAFILRDFLETAKFFDCSEVWPMVTHLGKGMYDEFEAHDRYDNRMAFLPDGVTWIESETLSIRDLPDFKPNEFHYWPNERRICGKLGYTYRTAHVFIAKGGITSTACRYLVGYETPRAPDKPRVWHTSVMKVLPLVQSGLRPERTKRFTDQSGKMIEYDVPKASTWDFVHYAALALINSPRIIGRHQHMPHERAERDKLKDMKLVGKFPLRAWTEIILKVALPDDRSGEASTEAHLTGERCLHFCRSHIRVRMGLIEYVAGHWRGNPALGMKRSRYVVTS